MGAAAAAAALGLRGRWPAVDCARRVGWVAPAAAVDGGGGGSARRTGSGVGLGAGAAVGRRAEPGQRDSAPHVLMRVARAGDGDASPRADVRMAGLLRPARPAGGGAPARRATMALVAHRCILRVYSTQILGGR